MPLNFYEDQADTGSVLESAIQPYDDGESADKFILNRPLQNLRNRTEVTRRASDFQDLLSRSDRGLIVASDIGAHIWFQEYGDTHGGYGFRISSDGGWGDWDKDLVLFPIVSSATFPETTPTAPILTKYVYDDGEEGRFAVYPQVEGTSRKVAQGASNLCIKIFKVANSNPPTPIVSIEGALNPSSPDPESGPITICVQIAYNNTTTISSVVSAINLHSAALTIVTAEVLEGGSRTISTEVARTKFYSSAGCVGGIDDEAFRISGEQLMNYFEFPYTNRLKEGSFLVFDFLSAKERLKNDLDIYPYSVLRTVHPGSSPGDTRNIGDCTGTVPICKMLNGNLHFFNGRSFRQGVDERFMDSQAEESRLRAELQDPVDPLEGDAMVGAQAKSSTLISLPLGTIHSQLTKLTDLGKAEVGKGASLVYSTYTGASPISPLTPGNFRSQLQELLNHLTDDTGADHGASKIGVEAYSPLSRGYVADQIHYIWNRQIHHEQVTADYHKLEAIETRPFVLVSQVSGEGYTTIAAALNAVKTTGGTIYIKGGTYTEAINLASVTVAHPIEFVGMGEDDVSPTNGEVVWQNASTYCLQIASDCVLQAKISFRNIRFASSGGTYPVVFATTAGHPQAVVEFRNCRFQSLASSRALILNQSSLNRSLIHDCILANSSAATDTNAVVNLTKGSVSIENCKFTYAGAIVYASSTDVKNVDVVGNEFVKCGYATAYANIQALIYVDGGSSTLARVLNNSYPAYTRVANEYAKFCRLTTCGGAIVSGNTIDIGTIPDVADSSHFAIQFTGPTTTTGWCQITRNQVTTFGTLIPIFVACERALITDNVFTGGTDQSSTSGYGMITNRAVYSLVRNNQLITANRDTYRLKQGIVAEGAAVSVAIISGNSIDGGSDSGASIRSDGAYPLILGNYIRGMNSTSYAPAAGIQTLSTAVKSIISENVILDTRGSNSAVGISAAHVIARGNIIVPLSTGNSAMGVSISTGDCVIAGNTIRLGTQTTRWGIACSSPGCVMVGNYIHNATTSISGTISDVVISGNIFFTAKYGAYFSGAQRLVYRGNNVYASSSADASGVHFECSSATKNLVIAGNNFHNVYRGAYFTSGSSAVNMASFVVLCENIMQAIATIAAHGISFLTSVTAPDNKRFSAISGNVITKTNHTALLNYNGIHCGGDKVAIWENIVRAGGHASGLFYYENGYGNTSGTGLGLGKDRATPNYDVWNSVGDENNPQVNGGTGPNTTVYRQFDINFNRKMLAGTLTVLENFHANYGPSEILWESDPGYTPQVISNTPSGAVVRVRMRNIDPPPADGAQVKVYAEVPVQDAIVNPISASVNNYWQFYAASYPKASGSPSGGFNRLSRFFMSFDRVMLDNTEMEDEAHYFLQYWNGSAWVNWGGTGLVTVMQWVGGSPSVIQLEGCLHEPPLTGGTAVRFGLLSGHQIQDTNGNPLQSDQYWQGVSSSSYPALTSSGQESRLRNILLNFPTMTDNAHYRNKDHYLVQYGPGPTTWTIDSLEFVSTTQVRLYCNPSAGSAPSGQTIYAKAYAGHTILDQYGNPIEEVIRSFTCAAFPAPSSAGQNDLLRQIVLNYPVAMNGNTDFGEPTHYTVKYGLTTWPIVSTSYNPTPPIQQITLTCSDITDPEGLQVNVTALAGHGILDTNDNPILEVIRSFTCGTFPDASVLGYDLDEDFWSVTFTHEMSTTYLENPAYYSMKYTVTYADSHADKEITIPIIAVVAGPGNTIVKIYPDLDPYVEFYEVQHHAGETCSHGTTHGNITFYYCDVYVNAAILDTHGNSLRNRSLHVNGPYYNP